MLILILIFYIILYKRENILFSLVSVQPKLCTFLDGQSVSVDVGLPWLPSRSMHIENQVHKYELFSQSARTWQHNLHHTTLPKTPISVCFSNPFAPKKVIVGSLVMRTVKPQVADRLSFVLFRNQRIKNLNQNRNRDWVFLLFYVWN